MRKFIYKIGIKQPMGPQRRSNDSISVNVNLNVTESSSESVADVFQDDSLIKI